MHRKLIVTIFTTLITAAGCVTTQDSGQTPTTVGEPPKTLTGDEIKSLISGRTVVGRTSDGFDIKAYNTPDGKISATSEQGGKTYRSDGTWEIQGNTVCAKWANKDWKPACSALTKNGETYLIKPTSSGVSPIPAAKYVDGNPYNL
jgi:hypothetical protein